MTSEQKLLIELLTDLEITGEELEVDINDITNTINLGVNILQVVNNKDNLDQIELERLLDGGIPGGFLANSGLFPRTIAYQNLKSLGFEKFSNDTIRYLTADIFDRKLVRIKDWELIIYQLEEKLNDIINKNFKLVASNDINIADKLTPISFSNFKNNRVLINGYANMQNSRRFVRNLYLELKVSIDELITLINIELNKE